MSTPLSQISPRTASQLSGAMHDIAPMNQGEVNLNTSWSNHDIKEPGDDEQYTEVRTHAEPCNTKQEDTVSHAESTARPLLECNICKKILKTRSSFKKHAYIHDNQRQFCCEFCGLGFNSCSTLMGHRRLHMGERPYKCRFCDRTFIESSNRTTHERRHTGEKPYICDICGRRFSVSCSMVRHRRIHTNETPYICVVCGKSYHQYNGLRNHMEKNHRYLSLDEIKMHCAKRDDIKKPPDERKHVCFCGKSFVHYYQLQNHRQTEHSPFKNIYTTDVKTEADDVAAISQNQMFTDCLGYFRNGVVPKRVHFLECSREGGEKNDLNEIHQSSFGSAMQYGHHSNVVPVSCSNIETKNMSDVDQFIVLRNVRL